MTVHPNRDRPVGDGRSYRYFRNAVERHWDPGAIDLSADTERIQQLADVEFDQVRQTLALFGAGEEAVTDDLAPLAVVLEDINDQMFVASQVYEEAKHADFFHRYWSTVIRAEEQRRGVAPSTPNDDRWFVDEYVELFDRTEAAMHRLLEADTPQNRAEAYCHYHLTVEGILAQTGYYGIQSTFSEDEPATPDLTGLVEGFSKIRADEGRHVGFGMSKLKDLVESGAVTPEDLHETLNELVGLTQGIVTAAARDEGTGPSSADLSAYASEKHVQRMGQITESSEDIPDVEELVAIDD